MGGAAVSLRKEWPRLLTILAPRQPGRAPEVAAALTEELGLRCVLWSSGGVEGGGDSSPGGGGSPGGSPGGGAVTPPDLEGADVLVLDVAADLPLMYW